MFWCTGVLFHTQNGQSAKRDVHISGLACEQTLYRRGKAKKTETVHRLLDSGQADQRLRDVFSFFSQSSAAGTQFLQTAVDA